MHILQRNAKTFEIPESTAPDNAIYNFEVGAWEGPDGMIAYDPHYQQVSKKCDVETGEDQKGQ